jgi:hypothetical protein
MRAAVSGFVIALGLIALVLWNGLDGPVGFPRARDLPQ